MTHTDLLALTPAVRTAWLSFHSPLHSWRAGEDVFCLHCDGVWKAEDVECDEDGEPTCPVCHDSGPTSFNSLPWWRGDLVEERYGIPQYLWNDKAVRAEPGKPRKLPDRNGS